MARAGERRAGSSTSRRGLTNITARHTNVGHSAAKMMMNTRFVRSEQMRKTVSLRGNVSVA